MGNGISLVRPGALPILAQADTATTTDGFSLDTITNSFGTGLGEFLPNLLGAVVILVIGIIAAYIVSWLITGLLKKTQVDERIAASVTRRPPEDVPLAKWISSAFFYIIALLAVIAALETLQ
ncbi:MAG: hypothetical protein AAGM27_11800, partial [Cyanobacteria bacterium J06554_3]